MSQISASAIERLLDRVRRPSRYIGGETNIARKDVDQVELHLCLAFPEVYEIGMSHLGLRILYDLLNRDDGFFAERAFCPWPDMEKLMREDGVPLWSLESRTPLGEFDVLGFSLQSEMINTNILTMLDLAGIPLLSSDRSDQHPIIIAGGPAVFNPEPVADFFDCFLIGDGELAFPAFLRQLRTLKKDQRLNRRETLRALAQLEGVYVPALYPVKVDSETGFTLVQDNGQAPYPIRKAVVDNLIDHPFPTEILVPQGEIVHERYAVEIARGCTQGCRFCQAGYIYRPMRERSPRQIKQGIKQGIKSTGYDEASLTSLSTADYSVIEPLVRAVTGELAEMNTATSVSSLRVYGLTERLAVDIARVRRTGFTIAPEAGTQRLRDVINKGITDEDIQRAAQVAFSAGWKLLKLYFMIGLPTETDEDVVAIANTAIKVSQLSAGARGKPRAKINLAVASFIPKPHSPFAWAAFADPEDLHRKQQLLLSLIKKHGNIRLKFHPVERSALEAVFARGDRRLSRVIKSAWSRGARFDEWDEQFHLSIWQEAFTAGGIDPRQYRRVLSLSDKLPWDHIDPGVKREFFKREYERGLRGRFTHPCEVPLSGRKRPASEDDLATVNDKLVCYSCGVGCELDKIAAQYTAGRDQARELISAPVEEANDGGITNAPANETKKHTYRLTFGKKGWSRYLSHLELVGVFQRAFRRAGIELAYSAGYHPHPKISYGPALPVGVEGDREYLDFCTTLPADPDELKKRLSAALPSTFPLGKLVALPAGATGITSLIDTFHYDIVCPDDLKQSIVSQIKDKKSADSWPIVRERKDRKLKFDARPFIQSVGEQSVVGEQGFALILKSVEGRTVKPAEILSSVLGELPPGLRIIRRKMGKFIEGKIMTPMDLICQTENA